MEKEMERIMKRLNKISGEIYQLRKDMVQEFKNKQNNVNNVTLNIDNWAQNIHQESLDQINDLQEIALEAEYDNILNDIE